MAFTKTDQKLAKVELKRIVKMGDGLSDVVCAIFNVRPQALRRIIEDRDELPSLALTKRVLEAPMERIRAKVVVRQMLASVDTHGQPATLRSVAAALGVSAAAVYKWSSTPEAMPHRLAAMRILG